jgi:hypothetical protein
MLTDDIMATKPTRPSKIENPFAEYRHNNRYGVLRVRWPFWLVMVLLVRHLLLLLMIGLSHRGAAGSSVGMFASFIDPKFIPADIPALILLFATGLAGRQAIAATTVAIERVVLRHMHEQIADLAATDPAATAALRRPVRDGSAGE